MTIGETNRLKVRHFEPAKDAADAFQVYGRPEVHTYLAHSAPTESVEDMEQRLEAINKRYEEINDGSGFWAIELKESGKVVGGILVKRLPDQDLKPTDVYEIGWHLNPDFWGQGIAPEAASSVLPYCQKDLLLTEIYAVLYKENNPSARVAEKIGMTFQKETRQYYGETLQLYKKQLP